MLVSPLDIVCVVWFATTPYPPMQSLCAVLLLYMVNLQPNFNPKSSDDEISIEWWFSW